MKVAHHPPGCVHAAFDMADQNAVSGRRNSSTVAPQALYMLNAPFVQEQAHFAAERASTQPR